MVLDCYNMFWFQNQNLSTIKLAPTNSGWNHGSGTKNTAQAGSNSMISLTKNMYSVLENVHADPSTLRGNIKTLECLTFMFQGLPCT